MAFSHVPLQHISIIPSSHDDLNEANQHPGLKENVPVVSLS
jgi:hypothetical protein